MFLTRLIYASTVSDSFLPTDLENILATARENNASAHVTGMLCFNRKYFLQSLEGSRARVNALYRAILNDPRHSDIIILNYEEIVVRHFAEWSMAYVPESSLTSPINIRFSGTPEFNPYTMSGASAHQMLRALKESIPSV